VGTVPCFFLLVEFLECYLRNNNNNNNNNNNDIERFAGYKRSVLALLGDSDDDDVYGIQAVAQ